MSILMRNSKKKKLHIKPNMDSDGRDRITDLPDVILHNIFSFLQMKDVIRTSILAKRWQNVWISAPNLLFFDQTKDKRTLFLDLVERSLLLRDSSIKKFFLGFEWPLGSCNASRFGQLISAALRHEVQELDLRVRSSPEHLLLPPRFTCESLVSLTLSVGFKAKFPYTHFPKLKRLNLMRVEFYDQDSAQQLFNGCPVLEKLTMMNCSLKNVLALSILSVTLRKLEIASNKLLVNASKYCKISISGQNLESFSFLGDLMDCYVIVGASSIAKASVEIWGSTLPRRDFAYCAGVLLNGLSSVDFLELSRSSVKALNHADGLQPELDVFTNLTHLKITESELICGWRTLQKILRNTPSLATICFEKGIGLGTYAGPDEWMLDPLPQCFSNHLKNIIIGFFCGLQSEINAIEMQLKHAIVLEKLVIVSSLEIGDEYCQGVKEAQEQILLLPRASVDCVIEYQ